MTAIFATALALPLRAGGERLGVLEPPAGDVDPTRDPDIAQALGVLDELPDRRGPARLAGPPGMEPHRHHLRPSREPLASVLVDPATAHVEVVGGSHAAH